MPAPPFEILPSLPANGPMYVSVSGDGKMYTSDGVVVRFHKTDGTNWVANFEPGWTKFSAVFELNNSSLLLVIAFVTCYFDKYYCMMLSIGSAFNRTFIRIGDATCI